MLVLTTATQSQILPRAECLPHTNPRMVKHHLHHLGNNHSFEQICLLEGNTSLLGVTLFPLSFWAEKAKPACSLPSFSQPLSGCVSLTDGWIDSDFLVGVFINLPLLFSLPLHPLHPQHPPQPVLYLVGFYFFQLAFQAPGLSHGHLACTCFP